MSDKNANALVALCSGLGLKVYPQATQVQIAVGEQGEGKRIYIRRNEPIHLSGFTDEDHAALEEAGVALIPAALSKVTAQDEGRMFHSTQIRFYAPQKDLVEVLKRLQAPGLYISPGLKKVQEGFGQKKGSGIAEALAAAEVALGSK